MKRNLSKFIDEEFEDLTFFLDGTETKPEEMFSKINRNCKIEVYIFKKFECVYKGKISKMRLIPCKSINENKKIILNELLKKQDIILNEMSLDLDKINLTIKIKNSEFSNS